MRVKDQKVDCPWQTGTVGVYAIYLALLQITLYFKTQRTGWRFINSLWKGSCQELGGKVISTIDVCIKSVMCNDCE